MSKTQFLQRIATVLCGIVLGAAVLSAQNKVVTGTVIDDTDQGVIGAAVMVKGTTNGVATDIDGKFTITCAPTDVLVISSVG